MTTPTEASKALAPLFLVDPEGEGPWSLCLSDSESPVELFEEEGHSGNGYAWDSVARIAMRGLSQPDRDAIEFGSEAGTFVALCSAEGPLLNLGIELAKLLRDDEALRLAIRSVPEEDWDD